MNSLLIYNNNIASTIADKFNELQLGNTFLFQIGKQELIAESFSVDKKIQDIITNEIENKQYDVIFIPYSLSEVNYLEFIGLRFAYHIRLTPEFNNIQTPIVFYGFEDAITLNKLSELGLILFTKNVSQTNKITVEDFTNQIRLIQQQKSENGTPISDDKFVSAFIKKIQITPSGNYSHHHSVTNEWSIYRWARLLKIPDGTIKKIERNIASNLYFKYLKAKYPIKNGASVNPAKPLGKGGILLIDDEVAKGWDSIYDVVCSDQEYSSFGEDFKNWDTQKIFSETITKIKAVDPDVVILDFRLHDDDFETSKITEVTGYKILKEIKENINPGIQVIISSATNKVLNLQALQDAGAADFILKESPELSADAEYSKLSIDKLTKSLSLAFRMSFLKNVYSEIKGIEAITPTSTDYEESDFLDRLKNNLDIAFKLLKGTSTASKYFNYAFLQLFQIIEDFSHLSYVFKEDSFSYVFVNGKEILVLQPIEGRSEAAIKFEDGKFKLRTTEQNNVRRLDMNFKISAIIIFRLGIESSSYLKWTDIYTNRNSKAAHFNPKDVVKPSDIITILKFIKNLINPINQSEINLKKGLTERSAEERIRYLKRGYKK